MKPILTLLVAALLMAASCERQDGMAVKGVSSAQMAGTYKLVDPASNYEVTLVLTLDSASSEIAGRQAFKVGGRSSVNQYFATLTDSSTSNAVQISAIGATKMAGPAEAMQFETTYFNKLQAVKRYEIDGNKLRLIAEGTATGTLVYEKTK